MLISYLVVVFYLSFTSLASQALPAPPTYTQPVEENHVVQEEDSGSGIK